MNNLVFILLLLAIVLCSTIQLSAQRIEKERGRYYYEDMPYKFLKLGHILQKNNEAYQYFKDSKKARNLSIGCLGIAGAAYLGARVTEGDYVSILFYLVLGGAASTSIFQLDKFTFSQKEAILLFNNGEEIGYRGERMYFELGVVNSGIGILCKF